jgi:hypothetical protein
MMDINDGVIGGQPIVLDPNAIIPMTRGAWLILSQVIKNLEERVKVLEALLQAGDE